jgi:hypothetical protein
MRWSASDTTSLDRLSCSLLEEDGDGRVSIAVLRDVSGAKTSVGTASRRERESKFRSSG